MVLDTNWFNEVLYVILIAAVVASIIGGLASAWANNRVLFWSITGVAGLFVVLGLLGWAFNVLSRELGTFGDLFFSIILWTAIAVIVIGGLVMLCLANRWLFWCVVIALLGHMVVTGTIWVITHFYAHHDDGHVIKVNIIHVPPPPPKTVVEKPKEVIKPLDIPKGREDAKKPAKTMPKGVNLKHSDSRPQNHRRSSSVMTNHFSSSSTTIPTDPGDRLEWNGNQNDDPTDDSVLTQIRNSGTGSGDPQGQGTGDVPAGFENGTINGRVYFIRLKYETGAWGANNDGTTNLLRYVTKNGFKCESESRAMSAQEINDRFLKHNAIPTFIYIYCDDSFKLTQGEVSVLQNYISQGGFLFMDSRYDSEETTQQRVGSQLARILPDQSLTPIPRSNPINTFLWDLREPGYGEAAFTGHGKNYGISLNGRLVVFYTPGNFSHLYSLSPPDADPWTTMQYQMGGNVIVYAIKKGDNSGEGKRTAAFGKVTSQTLKTLGFLDSSPAGGKTGPKKPGHSIIDSGGGSGPLPGAVNLGDD